MSANSNGTVVASYLDNGGLWLQDGSSISAEGTPTSPIQFTYYNTVQEQPNSCRPGAEQLHLRQT
jgi:hypothetical protein